jgi:hypothetical protein
MVWSLEGIYLCLNLFQEGDTRVLTSVHFFFSLYASVGGMIALTYSLPYIVTAVVQAQFISAIHIIYDRYKFINK